MKKHELEAAIKAAQAAQLAGGGGGMSSNESTTILPDGSAFAIWSLPLPEDHWLTAPYAEWDDVRDTLADTPTPILTHALREHVIWLCVRTAAFSCFPTGLGAINRVLTQSLTGCWRV